MMLVILTLQKGHAVTVKMTFSSEHSRHMAEGGGGGG